jgi:hypothetical protein
MEGTISRAREDGGLKNERTAACLWQGWQHPQKLCGHSASLQSGHSHVGQGPEVAP